MTRIPVIGEDARIDLVQGSAFDETWTFLDPDAELEDFTGYTAVLRIAKDADSAPFLILSTTHGVGADGLDFGAGTLRIFITAATQAAWNETDEGKFTAGCDCDSPYQALHTLLFTVGGVTTVEAIGPVGFQPIVQPA